MPRCIRIVKGLRARSHDMHMACNIFLAGYLDAVLGHTCERDEKAQQECKDGGETQDVSESSQGYVLNHMECT